MNKFMSILAITMVAAVTLSCTCGTKTAKPEQRPANIHGVDVSHHNGVIDWNTLATDKRLQFVFIKATEGVTFRDSLFLANVKGAKAAGLKVGAYHFLTTSSSAEKQFENFKNYVPKEEIDLRPVLDAESISKGYSMSVDEYRAHARKWADLCLAYYGVTPIIYSSLEFYRAYLKGEFDDCPFGVGDVDASQSYVDGEPWTIWQKAIKTIPGTHAALDYNVLAPGKSLAEITLHP